MKSDAAVLNASAGKYMRPKEKVNESMAYIEMGKVNNDFQGTRETGEKACENNGCSSTTTHFSSHNSEVCTFNRIFRKKVLYVESEESKEASLL